MKLTVILLLSVCLAASATGFSQKVTLNVKDSPLEKVFQKIEKQTGYYFAFTKETIRDARPVSLQVSDADLKTVLDQCLKGQQLSYVITAKVISIRKAANNSGAPSEEINPLVTIRGRVVNEKGEVLEGVTVVVKGTNLAMATDANGEFEFKNLDPEAVLVFTSVNTEPRELPLSGRTMFVVTLKTKVSALDDVQVKVNTGYQRISKERYIGSVSTLDSAAFHRRVGERIIDRLDGMVTGMLFDKKGVKSSAFSNIQIRGLSTLFNASNSPLVIVDNFPFAQDLNSINPNDVESITVLKDAAATSIWGARAGNGVIVITTKKGKYNQPLQISISSNIKISSREDLYYYPSIAVPDIIDIEHMLFKAGRYDADIFNTTNRTAISPVVEILARRRAGLISAADSATQIDGLKGLDLRRDLDEYVYRHAVTQSHYFSVGGGSNLFNYTFSGGYDRMLNGVQHSRPDQQFTFSSTAAFRASKNLEVTAGAKYTHGIAESATLPGLGKHYPYAQLADAEGNALPVAGIRRLGYVDTAGAGALLDWHFRPLDEVKYTDSRRTNRLLSLNTGISYRINSWLSVTGSYQFNNQTLNFRRLYDLRTYFARDLINQFTNLAYTSPELRNPLPVGGIVDISYQESNSHNLRGQLNFNKSFGIKHQVSSLVMAEISQTRTSGYANRLFGYDKESGTSIASLDFLTRYPSYGGISGTLPIPNDSREYPWQLNRFVSFAANVSYTFNGRYTLYGSARKDGSNYFGVNTNRKWKPLWSAGLSWDIRQEPFFKASWISALRLRGSYGVSGNPGTASALATMNYSSRDAYTGFLTANLQNAPNPDLKWENVQMTNLALDFGVLQNRITGSFELFQKRCTDVLSTEPTPFSTGVSGFVNNVADMKGHGFELSLLSRNIEGPFKWQTSFGLSHARMIVTKILSLGTGNYDKVNAMTSYAVNPVRGRLVYGLTSYRWAGLDPLTGAPRGYLNGQVSTDYIGIGNDTLDNQVYHGSSIPLYNGFVLNTFSWKGFSVSANISYRLGFYFRRPSINYNSLTSNLRGDAEYYQRWKQPGDEAFTNVPAFIYPVNAESDRFYQYAEITALRGDNIRLQDIRLQYSWGNKRVRRISAYLYINNLNFIIWRKSGYPLDPDFVGAGGDPVTPIPVSYTAGITLDL